MPVCIVSNGSYALDICMRYTCTRNLKGISLQSVREPNQWDCRASALRVKPRRTMGKTQIKSEDIFKRISFLYQAAAECLETTKNIPLCRYYVDSLQAVARKNRISLHPDIKRSICKRCTSLLVPGITSTVRTKKRRQKQTTITCMECGTTHRYVYNPKFTPKIDKEETWDNVFINGQAVGHKMEQKPGKKQKQQGKNKQGGTSATLHIPMDTGT